MPSLLLFSPSSISHLLSSFPSPPPVIGLAHCYLLTLFPIAENVYDASLSGFHPRNPIDARIHAHTHAHICMYKMLHLRILRRSKYGATGYIGI